MPITPEDAIVDEFTAYYNADVLPGFIADHLEEQADDSGARLLHILGRDGAVEAAELLRAMADDREHPLLELINTRTMFDWNADDESWERFQRITRRMADRSDEGAGRT